ncbi:MAG: hypothetical protein K2L70_02350 [Clostridia bacterium]|nr:hypothetical protein [Clostridia bacterium]
MKYWWISIIIIAMAALMVVCAWLLRKSRKASMITLFVVSFALLIFKSIQFGIERSIHHYPIEFSHMSYFILGATMTVGVKKLRPFAGLCAFISGLAFVLAGIFSPAPIYEDAENTFNWVSGIIQHEVLLFAGLVIIFNTDRYSIKDIWIPIVGIVIMFIFSVLVYKRIIYPDLADKNHDSMIIIYVLYGTILKYVLPAGTEVAVWLRVITIIVEVILLGAILWAFYFINNKFYDKKIKKYPEFVGNNEEYSAIALVKFLIKKVNDKKAAKAVSADLTQVEGEDKEENKSE